MEMVLETARLLFRQFTMDDADLLVDLDSDPEVMRYLTGGAPTPKERIQSDILPTFVHSSLPLEGFGVWAMTAKTDSTFVGWVAFRPVNAGDPTEVSLGYRLRRSAWGLGLATEAAQRLIYNGFTRLGVQRVVATTYEYNWASRRVMEKVGMILVRSFRLSPADLLTEATSHHDSLEIWEGDEVEYALDRDTWERHEAARTNKE